MSLSAFTLRPEGWGEEMKDVALTDVGIGRRKTGSRDRRGRDFRRFRRQVQRRKWGRDYVGAVHAAEALLADARVHVRADLGIG